MDKWKIAGLLAAGPEPFSEAIAKFTVDELDDISMELYRLSQEQKKLLWAEYDRRGVPVPP